MSKADEASPVQGIVSYWINIEGQHIPLISRRWEAKTIALPDNIPPPGWVVSEDGMKMSCVMVVDIANDGD